MEKALRVINEMQGKGLIENYAIGGGMAVLFYSEPILTYDLDLFVFLPKSDGRSPLVISLDGLYSYLKKRGYRPDREHILIEGVPVQMIPAYNPLIEEAVKKSKSVIYGKTKTKVISLEHLMAIFLETNRAKDAARMTQILSRVKLNKSAFTGILKRHHLLERWHDYEKKYGLKI